MQYILVSPFIIYLFRYFIVFVFLFLTKKTFLYLHLRWTLPTLSNIRYSIKINSLRVKYPNVFFQHLLFQVSLLIISFIRFHYALLFCGRHSRLPTVHSWVRIIFSQLRTCISVTMLPTWLPTPLLWDVKPWTNGGTVALILYILIIGVIRTWWIDFLCWGYH